MHVGADKRNGGKAGVEGGVAVNGEIAADIQSGVVGGEGEAADIKSR